MVERQCIEVGIGVLDGIKGSKGLVVFDGVLSKRLKG